jgi:hypothetical protein
VHGIALAAGLALTLYSSHVYRQAIELNLLLVRTSTYEWRATLAVLSFAIGAVVGGCLSRTEDQRAAERSGRPWLSAVWLADLGIALILILLLVLLSWVECLWILLGMYSVTIPGCLFRRTQVRSPSC